MSYVAIVIVVIAGILLLKTANFKVKDSEEYEEKIEKVDFNKVAINLGNAIKIKTVSYPDPKKVDWDKFIEFHKFLDDTYPLIRKNFSKEVIGEYSLLYKWEGTNKTKEPLALLSHIDVVPVSRGTEKDWVRGSFSGDIHDGSVWGRGALDMKGHLIATMEACEKLLEKGYKPEQDVYLCFGHDEEIVGNNDGGAIQIAKELKRRNVKLGMVIDEGGAIIPGDMFNIKENIATIGVGEKGYMDVKVICNSKGGHSSQPPKVTGLVELSKFIMDLQKKPMKIRLTKTVDEFFDTIGRRMEFKMKIILANLWLTKPIFLKSLSNSPVTNAMIRTSITPTMSEGSPSENVLPQNAYINLNCRILQGETIDDVLDYLKKVANNSNFEFIYQKGKNPSAISSTDCKAFDILKKSMKQVYNNLPITPYLVVGGTDSYFYEMVCDHIYRIGAFESNMEQIATLHGTNEKMRVDALEKGVNLFMNIIQNYNKEI